MAHNRSTDDSRAAGIPQSILQIESN